MNYFQFYYTLEIFTDFSLQIFIMEGGGGGHFGYLLCLSDWTNILTSSVFNLVLNDSYQVKFNNLIKS